MNPDHLMLREFQPQDLERLAELYQKIFPDKNVTSDTIKKIIRDEPARILLAEADSQIRGFVYFWTIHDVFEIIDLGVDENVRGLGVAKKLLNHFFAMAKTEGIKKIQLEVSAENHAASSLYIKLGFVSVGVRKGYYEDGTDCVLMDKIV